MLIDNVNDFNWILNIRGVHVETHETISKAVFAKVLYVVTDKKLFNEFFSEVMFRPCAGPSKI